MSEHKSTTVEILCDEQKMDKKEEKENLTLLTCKDSLQHIRTKNLTKNVGVRKSTLASSSSSNNHYLVRQSIRFYAASSVILALCYLITPISASSMDSASHPV